ncbi:MAG: hypothetical protein LBG79_07715 [Spirochaetaceae bacterium]|nr:hypothetical protein [Spirochaetaceae bacterium]
MEPLVYIKRLCVKNAGLYALLFVFSALLFGCATAKHPFDIGSYKTVVSDFAFFPEGALFYGFADKTKNRVIFNTLFEPFTKTNSAAKYVFSKTKKASFALFYSGKRPQLLALLRGNAYPVGTSSIYFKHSDEWSKNDGGFWYSKKNRLALSIKSGSVLLASGGAVFNPEAGIVMPASCNEFWRNAPAGGIILKNDYFESYLESQGVPLKLPIEQILFLLLPRGKKIEIELRLETPGRTQAKLVASLLTIMRNNGQTPDDFPILEIFLANAPRLDGNAVLVTSAPISPDELRAMLPAAKF